MSRPIVDLAWRGTAAVLLSVLGHALVLALWETTAPMRAMTQSPTNEASRIQVRPTSTRVIHASHNSAEQIRPRSPRKEPAVIAPDTGKSTDLEAAPPDAAKLGVFRPADELDQPPLPASEPSIDNLEVPTALARTIRLRIYVDTSGHVARVEALEPDEEDGVLLKQLDKVFYDTKFIPGMDRGVPVPAYLDIEILPEPALL